MISRRETEVRVSTPIPKKPARAASRETLRSLTTRLDHEYIESPPPVPPKRSSRSRGTSLAPDDDGTSHGTESIPEIGYTEEEIPQDDNDLRLDYPGYAMIDKREKPPRPPPPRRRRDDKFATTPRSGKAPERPQRAYSTLRPARSRTPSEVTSLTLQDNVDDTRYEELASSDDEERDLRRGVVVSKIQGRPLPAPPRPPRSRRERNDREGDQEISEFTNAASEAFASTQTDPLPDDMVIEEEVTQAKLIVSPSRSGSQILVCTERIPTPTNNVLLSTGKSVSQFFLAAERPSSPTTRYSDTEFKSEPPERSVSETFHRTERTPSPVRRSTAPVVPPLPLYTETSDDFNFQERAKSRSKSPSLTREIRHVISDHEEDEPRLQSSPSARMRIEDELEQARILRSALLSTEPLKIASLEVADLRVDRLSVSNLEASKIAASEIEALIVSAGELSNTGETPEPTIDLHPTLLRELIAIRSQLELVSSTQQESSRQIETPKRKDETRPVQQSLPVHLKLDEVSRSMETRAIFSSVGSSRESSPQPIPPPRTISGVVKKDEPKEDTERSSSRSRSSSPGRTGPGGHLRQTASPVKSLPPVISVTPDAPEMVRSRVESSEMSRPQRAVISYAENEELSAESTNYRPASPPVTTESAISRYIAFSTSQIPPEFFSLASPTTTTARPVTEEPGVFELGQQLLRALSLASKRAMRHFVAYVVNRIGHEETDTKMREVEIALCALLLIVVGLLIVCFGGPRNITHHHHWDYFNPPRL